ncbi:MerR family transcriptional regulator [Amycolatopsis sp. NPDC051102]|uniref:MerR family transcriptional regulator n=1 Tax=Amycolatopsis sp. NPDC051102 TaxID=3155163 RepID=UPI00343BE1DC
MLRFWEAEGLLTPARVGARRRYSDADLLTARSAADRAAMAARQRDRLRARIARAQAALDLLEGDCPHDDLMACPNFRGLLAERLRG